MYWLPERQDMGSIRAYVDPASGIAIPEQVWLEVSGHLDDTAAQTCQRSSHDPLYNLATPEEAVAICRGRFVVTAIPGLHHGAALGDAPLGWTSSMGDVPAALLPLLSLVGANPR
jgi:hypothetical protein